MGRKKCSCQFCTKWSPIKEKVQTYLPKDLSEQFELMMNYFLSEAEDAEWQRFKNSELREKLAHADK